MVTNISLSTIYRMLLLALIIQLTACASAQHEPPIAVEQPIPKKAEAQSTNPFLAGLTARELAAVKQEAWHYYGYQWRTIAKRSRYVRQPLLDTLDRYHYPRDLQMIPVVESSYNPYAHSEVGAAGLWQLMPVTAKDLHIITNDYFEGRRAIRASTHAAARYLSKQHRRFGTWEMAFAAYHLGPAAVQRRLKRHHWTLKDGLRKMPLPPITKTYIRHILGLIALHEEGRISFPKPYATQTIKVQTPIDIHALQENAGLPANQIFRFNPELRLARYLDQKPATLSLRISRIRVKAVKQQLPAQRPRYMNITIKQGEHLSTIGRRFHIGVRQLLAYNPGTPKHPEAGHKIRLPISLIKHAIAQENPLISPMAKQKLIAELRRSRG